MTHTNKRAYQWTVSGDTGLSSKAIWAAMMGVESAGDYPHDPSDFGRCYRLLKLIPEWQERLPEIAKAHPHWQPLVDRWDEMTALYEKESPNGYCPDLYRLMISMRDEIMALQGFGKINEGHYSRTLST